ncbi:hypothetical protein J2755_000880 [Methanohalophilus levihalophilus]|nr:hypothetical protein [Methanohalophilus levihalophilus]MBP2029946.1 hypothetical protein [Methanohalophilus levihalophilus]
MKDKVLLYKQEIGKSDPAVAFSAVMDEKGKIYRNRLYRFYSGHGYNRR